MTWTDLKADLIAWLDRSDSDADAKIAKCITLAEDEFERELRVPDQELTSTSTINAERLELPANFKGMKAVYLDYDTGAELVKVPLSSMSLTALRDEYPFELTGVPRHFAISGDEMVFGPAPEDDYPITLTYYTAFPRLGVSVATNWLLDSHKDLYMAAGQWQASILWRDWEAVAYFRAETNRLIEAVRKSGMKRTLGAATITIPSPVRSVRGVRA